MRNFAKTNALRMKNEMEGGTLSIPKLLVTPLFLSWVIKVRVLKYIAFLTPFFLIFCGYAGAFTSAFFGVDFLKPSESTLFGVFFIGSLFFTGASIKHYFFIKNQYKEIKCYFYSKKLEYYESNFNFKKQTINYENIATIKITKTLTQKLAGLGTIHLSPTLLCRLLVSDGLTTDGRIHLVDIENPDKVYRQIQQLLNKSIRSSPCKTTKKPNGSVDYIQTTKQ